MARPKKAPHERRSERITIRLTPDELAGIQAQAETAGLEPVEFARRHLLGARVVAMPSSVKAAKAETADLLISIDALTGQTKRIGKNVDQIARSSSSGADFVQWWADVGAELKAHIVELSRLTDRVADRL